jgi:hypothetical protein
MSFPSRLLCWSYLPSYGHLLERDLNYGLPVRCYVCTEEHKASGIARIRDNHNQSTLDVPVCEVCLISDSRNDALIRKYWKTPDLKIIEGGEVTIDQLTALIDKQDTTEH